MDRKYYVYEFFNINTGEIVLVGAGSRNRMFDYDQSRSTEFKRVSALRDISSRVYKKGLTREEAIRVETERIQELKELGEPLLNILGKGTIPPGSYESSIKKSLSSSNKTFSEKHKKRLSTGAAPHRPEIKKRIGDTLKGRNTKEEYWLVELQNGNQLTFNTRQEIADRFGVSKSLVNNWKYDTISIRWKEIIKSVKIVENPVK